MSGFLDWLRGKAAEDGVEISDDELAKLGLSDDHREDPEGDVLSVELPGQAAGAVELFASPAEIGTKSTEKEDGLMWEPIIREGQWALRPGGKNGKRRSPLKVIAGRSKNQRKEIGLQDLLEAFNDRAIEHVTVPTSHSNHVLENTGFIKGMKIVDGSYTPKGRDESVKVKVLMGGYDFKVPTVKEKVSQGAIASRSAGILYDYADTETGKVYPAVVEHVALTNKPWITGMTVFGRKVKVAGEDSKELSVVSLSLSNDEPEEEDLLAQDDVLEELHLATESSSWSQQDSPNWLRQQVNQLLDQARAQKIAAKRQGSKDSFLVDYPPSYRCVEAKPGSALIADNWGDDANFWTAPITVTNGEVQLGDFEQWEALKKAFIPDEERPKPPKDKLPLEQQEQKTATETLSRRERAIVERKKRAGHLGNGTNDNTTTPPRGGEHMAGQNEERLSLSEEARQMIEAAEARARAAEEKADRLSREQSRNAETLSEMRADRKIDALKTAGFTEDRGFGGVLAYARNVYLADDGEPALQSDSFSDNGNSTGELTLSQVVDGIFGAFQRAEDGKIKFGEQLTQPPEKVDSTSNKGESEEAEGKTKLSDGKPGGGSEENEVAFADLPYEDQIAKLNEELKSTPLDGQVKVKEVAT